MSQRRICIVTGSRAEYGLLCWLMKEIQYDADLRLQIAVTGMHLSPEFGLTYQCIESDGFSVDAKIEMLLSSDTPVAVAKSIGLGVIGFADAFEKLRPDIVVVLGDRFEIIAAAQAALVARIPIAHIHGGEVTEGAIDEALRHSITKMATFHFVAAEPYRRRVIQMGEQPDRVFNVGAPALDYANRLKLMNRQELEAAINFELGEPTLLVTYHPATLSERAPSKAFEQVLNAIDAIPNARVIFTKSNADAGGRIINQMIDNFVAANSERAVAFTSLGQHRYLSALRHVSVVLGNSSSGLIEAPAAKTPTVNIGDRQQGRLKAKSVINCLEQEQSILDAVEKALSPEFRQVAESAESPYGQGNTAEQIKGVLKETPLTGVVAKRFFDLTSDVSD